MNLAPKLHDEVKDAKINVILQLVLLIPTLMIFGFTVFNVVTAIGFFVLALVRLAFPTERMRKIEFNLSLVLLVVWLAITFL